MVPSGSFGRSESCGNDPRLNSELLIPGQETQRLSLIIVSTVVSIISILLSTIPVSVVTSYCPYF